MNDELAFLVITGTGILSFREARGEKAISVALSPLKKHERNPTEPPSLPLNPTCGSFRLNDGFLYHGLSDL